jgi:DNA polymerase-3 subunit delta
MIITLSGPNALLLQDRLKQLTQDFVQAHGDLALERLDATETPFARLQEAVQALPFLAQKRLVIIDSPSASKELNEHIDQLIDSVQDSTELILVETKFDKRSVLYKTLQKQSQFEEFGELNEAQLPRWLMAYAKEQGGALGSSQAQLLIQRAGTNQLKLKHELDKLLSFQSEISKSSIEELVSSTPQSSTFDLLDAALAGRAKQALQLYEEQRRQRVDPQAILALLGWQLHVLAVVKAGGDRTVDQIAREAKLSPFVVRKTMGVAKRLTMTTIKEIVATTTELDGRLKRESLDADEAVQNLLLTMANAN